MINIQKDPHKTQYQIGQTAIEQRREAKENLIETIDGMDKEIELKREKIVF